MGYTIFKKSVNLTFTHFLKKGNTMATTLYLIRHGETEWNKIGRFQGSSDIALSDKGIKQAQQAAKVLKGKLDYIYTSPLSRAKQTAEIIAEANHITVQIENDIREINFGVWEGLTFDEIKKNYPVEFASWRNPEEGYLMSDDISIRNAGIRAGNVFRNLAEKHQGKRIAIVAHGAILKAGIINLFEFNMTMYHKIFLGNTSISKIIFKKIDSPVLATLNNLSHLPEESI